MLDKKEFESLKKYAREIRQTVLSIIVAAHASHIASSYSIVELIVYLYEKILKIDPKNPQDPNRDRFILSKGWGISTLYTILARKGFFEKNCLIRIVKMVVR